MALLNPFAYKVEKLLIDKCGKKPTPDFIKTYNDIRWFQDVANSKGSIDARINAIKFVADYLTQG